VCEKKYQAAAESEKMFATLGIPLEYFDPTVEQY